MKRKSLFNHTKILVKQYLLDLLKSIKSLLKAVIDFKLCPIFGKIVI